MENAEQTTREKGQAVMRQIMGDAYVDKIENDIAAGVPGMFTAEHSVESCFATIWGRPGLDMRSRSIATIAMVIALREPAAIKNHMRGGMRLGLTPKEIEEIVYQAIPYLGYPLAGVGLRALHEVLKEDGLI